MLGIAEPHFVPGHEEGRKICGIEFLVDEEFFGELGDEIVEAGVEGFVLLVETGEAEEEGWDVVVGGFLDYEVC